jgi:hypothetical protein
MIICAPPLVVRNLTFRDAAIADVVSELQKPGRFVKLKGDGLNIVVLPKAGEGRRISGMPGFDFQCKRIDTLPTVTLSLGNLPISEVVGYVAEYSGMRVEWNDRGALFKCSKEARESAR